MANSLLRLSVKPTQPAPRLSQSPFCKPIDNLGAKLDWIAVDHHNTGHPHTHILVRGVMDDGRILNIAGDYISHGVRERASEIVTLDLGQQTEQEVSRQLEREVDAERFTRLDRLLIAEQQANNEFAADLRPDRDMLETARRDRALLIARDLPLSCHPVAIRASAVCMPCGVVGATDSRRSWWSVAVSLAA